MGQPEKHVAQWRHNREFLRSIDARFPDWKVTAAFYVDLHAIDALLESDGVSVTIHETTHSKARIATRKYGSIMRRYMRWQEPFAILRNLGHGWPMIRWGQKCLESSYTLLRNP